MVTASSLTPRLQFGRALRERFLGEISEALVDVSAGVMTHLTSLLDESVGARESQIRRDVWTAFKRVRPIWVESTVKDWRACLEPAKEKKAETSKDPGSLELVGTEVVENKILASRLVLAVSDKVHAELDDLRVRIKYLERIEDLDGRDLFRPEVLVLLMVEQWTRSGMQGDSWPLVSEVIQRGLVDRLKLAYQNANKVLISKGVLPTIELKDRVRTPVRFQAPRSAGPAGAAQAPAGPADHAKQAPGQAAPHADAGYGYGDSQNAGLGWATAPGGSAGASADFGAAPAAPGFFGGRLGWGARATPSGASASPSGPPSGGGAYVSGQLPFWKQAPSTGGQPAGYDDGAMPQMMTPVAYARQRAQGVMGQIRRIFTSYLGPEVASAPAVRATPALVQALAPQRIAAQYAAGGTMYEDYSPAGVARVAGDLAEQSAELKKKAETKGEKAIIELVALMFQAILAEERIPPGIRVWFARLQMPVLRVALEDPEFFSTTDHPARLLIDRMGSCVMGFDASGVQDTTMEAEVRRIVQVIEQYPETGKKVYQIVFDEFQKFLAKFLTEKGNTQKVVSVAQQVEQKETLAIQYTIEMRNMLKEIPVRDEIRDFLFKVWAEVLAVSALRKGPKHADTVSLKKCSTDLLWAASAKPNRADRARVIQDLPDLLRRLRTGMSLLAMAPSEQEAHVKKISDTLADAFLSKTQAIPQAQIDAMALRLGSLEDFVTEDGVGDLPLDAESLEMMLGIDTSAIEVITDGGSKPTPAMQAWATELQLGTWYTLDHNRQIAQVQLAWRSERKHLNLFASTTGKSFLIQAGRLAAYLQAGLLLPQEEEALTVRATRTALAKLEANPERLLA